MPILDKEVEITIQLMLPIRQHRFYQLIQSIVLMEIFMAYLAAEMRGMDHLQITRLLLQNF